MTSSVPVYVKVFSQILDSSLSLDYEQRHIFYDLLVLADREGVIDMTHDAISRRTNVPLEIIQRNIEKLEQPDPMSRSQGEEGRRLVRLADHRNWGWQVVNYTFYRDLIDLESLRASNRERKREQRRREKEEGKLKSRIVTNGHAVSHNVRDSHAVSQSVTPSESYSESETKEKKPTRKLAADAVSVPLPLFLESKEFRQALGHWIDHKKLKRDPLTQHALELVIKDCERWGPGQSIKNIEYSIKRGWKGIFQEEANPTEKDKINVF